MPSNQSKTNPERQPLPVVFPLDLWHKMMGYIQACPIEVNGFGTVEVRQGIIHVTDVFILDQVATGHSVEVDEDAYHAHVQAMMRAGQNPGSIKFQWHSHVDFDAYFSGTDTANIARWSGDWLVSFVGNKRGQYSMRYDQFQPVQLEPIPVFPMFQHEPDTEMLAAIAAEVKAKVRQPGGTFRRQRAVAATAPSPASVAVVRYVDDLFVSDETEEDGRVG